MEEVAGSEKLLKIEGTAGAIGSEETAAVAEVFGL